MNSFPMRRPESVSHSLSRLAEFVGAPPPKQDLEIRGVAPLSTAAEDELGLVAQRRYVREIEASRAGALLVAKSLVERLPEDRRPKLVVNDPHLALVSILELLFPLGDSPAEIHPSAVLGRGVQLGSGVRISPYVVIEEGAHVGDACRIGAHSVIGAGARIGRGAILHPQVVVYPRTIIGERVILHAGSRIGVDGFGYAQSEGRHRKIPQIGGCVIEDDVEIGANTTVDRGSIGETRVHEGAKLDNLVQLGHNVVVGPHAILAGQVGVAGSSRVGAGVMAGGQAGISGHVAVGDGAKLGAQSGIAGDIAPGEVVVGYPARPRLEFLRSMAALNRVPELLERVRKLERS